MQDDQIKRLKAAERERPITEYRIPNPHYRYRKHVTHEATYNEYVFRIIILMAAGYASVRLFELAWQHHIHWVFLFAPFVAFLIACTILSWEVG